VVKTTDAEADVAEARFNARGRILAVASMLEGGTGVVVMIAPVLFVKLLLGTEVSTDGVVVVTCFGVALLAFGLACWPGRAPVERAAPAIRGMLVYNALIAVYLTYVGIVLELHGLLLWPAALLHALVALLLAWTSRKSA
jgi:hypothetical protein